MYFLSNKITNFIKQKLNYTDEMWLDFQYDYIYVFEIYLEVEINEYLSETKNVEELNRLVRISKEDPSGQKLIDEFFKIYKENEVIRSRIDARLVKYNENILAIFIESLSTTSRKEFSELLDTEINRYEKARKVLEKRFKFET